MTMTNMSRRGAFARTAAAAALAALIASPAFAAGQESEDASLEERAAGLALLAYGEGRCEPTHEEAKMGRMAREEILAMDKASSPEEVAERKKLQIKFMARFSERPGQACKQYRQALAAQSQASKAAGQGSHLAALKPAPSEEALGRAISMAMLPLGDKICRPSLENMAVSRDAAAVLKYLSAKAGDSKALVEAAAADVAAEAPKKICAAYAETLKSFDAKARAQMAQTSAAIRRGEDPAAAEAKAAAEAQAREEQAPVPSQPAPGKSAQEERAPSKAAPKASAKPGSKASEELDSVVMLAGVLAAGRNSCQDPRGLKDAALDIVLVLYDTLQSKMSERELSAKLKGLEAELAKAGPKKACALYEQALASALKEKGAREQWAAAAAPVKAKMTREAAKGKAAK